MTSNSTSVINRSNGVPEEYVAAILMLTSVSMLSLFVVTKVLFDGRVKEGLPALTSCNATEEADDQTNSHASRGVSVLHMIAALPGALGF